MSQELYLVFPDEQTATATLTRTEGAIEADPEIGIDAIEGYQVPNYRNIDTIGVMYNNDGVYDESGEVVTPPTVIPGWHVNILLLDGENGDALAPYAIEVNSPMRKWKTEVSA